MLELFGASPAVAVAIGIALVVVGVGVHAYLLAVAGGLVAVISAGRWVRNRRSRQHADSDRPEVH